MRNEIRKPEFLIQIYRWRFPLSGIWQAANLFIIPGGLRDNAVAMCPYSTVKPRKGTRKDPYHVIPMPPKSVVRLVRADAGTPKGRKQIDRIFRIGYYGQQDGLDCIWLVNEDEEYEQSTDHDYLFKYFEIIVVSDEKNLYGRNRPELPAVRKP